MHEHTIKLGQRVRDVVTGLEGIATARVEFLTGCAQYGVAPGLDKDGKVMDTQYFDWTRLRIVDAALVMDQRPEPAFAGGPNRDAPRR